LNIFQQLLNNRYILTLYHIVDNGIAALHEEPILVYPEKIS